MRIGRLNQILEAVCNDQNQIVLTANPIYGGQAYEISDSPQLINAITALLEVNLLGFDIDEPTSNLVTKLDNTNIINADEYNVLSALVNNINTTLPTKILVIKNFSPNQDEHIINIKLPGGVDKINDYGKYNERIAKIFQKFGINTENIKIVGFDTGSKWYQLLFENVDWIFPSILQCISIAIQMIDFRQNKKEASGTKNEVDAINNNFVAEDKNITEVQYIEKLVDEKIKQETNKVIKESGAPGGKTSEEALTMLVNATKELIKEMGKGTEFHLSLNPPEYVKNIGEGASFSIDYSAVPKIEKSEQEIKQLESVKLKPQAEKQNEE